MEKLKLRIAVGRLEAVVFNKPVFVIKEITTSKKYGICVKIDGYIVVPNNFWKIKEIEVFCPLEKEYKILDKKFERLLYDKRLYSVTIVTKFKNPGRKIMLILIKLTRRRWKVCQIKFAIKN